MVHKDGRFLNSSPHLGLFNGGLGGGKRILEREANDKCSRNVRQKLYAINYTV